MLRARSALSLIPAGLFAGLLVAATASWAQAQTLRGVVLEKGTDRPIAMARTVLVDARGDSVLVRLTDDDGAFTLPAPESGDFLLVTMALGYRVGRAGIFELGVGGEISVEVRLDVEPVLIEGIGVELQATVPVLVSSGFLDRYKEGLGHFLTPEDLEKGEGLLLEDRLAKLPGVRVRGGRVQLVNRGWRCTPPIYLDGQRAWGVDGDIDMLVGLEHVEAVEVYRGISETPPRWLGTVLIDTADRRRVQEPCGAIVIWTKRRG